IADHFTAGHNPGDFVPANEDIRDATYFYYCRGVSELLTSSTQARELIDELIRRQRDDGSWANRFTDGREDDPLVATPMAGDAPPRSFDAGEYGCAQDDPGRPIKLRSIPRCTAIVAAPDPTRPRRRSWGRFLAST